MAWDTTSFLEKLEKEHSFPGNYLFKFIVPSSKKEELLSLLPKGKLSFRESKKSTYVSVTLEASMSSALGVVSVYQNVYSIPGIVAL
ncbi:MAG: DUF493 domain-containing protein [Cyclobacteriaceae bacterium]|nr:DUF493 domain-containing protein [Cyclobacteriaceae bacterium]